MRPTLIPTLISFLLPFTLLAQQDEKAGEILERLSEKHREKGSVSANFTSRMVNKEDGVNMEKKGELKMKGDKFFLDIGDQKVYCDGETRWTFLEGDNEVQIKKAEEEAEDGGIVSPTDLFTIWEKDFKYKYAKRIEEDGRNYHVIELYPEDPEGKAFHTIEMKIDTEKDEIREVTVKGKQGNDYIYVLDELKAGMSFEEGTFVFDPSEHPGIEKVDLR